MKKVIYDFGANIGNDIPYYLKKADVVVAGEANPKLTNRIKDKFADAVRSGRLIVENCVLNSEGANSDVSFFIHNRNHALRQLPPPKASSMSEFSLVRLPSCRLHEIVARYGDPY